LIRSVLLPRHQAENARVRDDGDLPQLLTYGDVPAEYRAAQDAAVVFDETHRGRVEIAGADAAAFLHRILANDVRSLTAGQGNRNLLLSSKGKVRFDFDLFRGMHSGEPDGFALSVPPRSSAALLAALDMYLFAEKVVAQDGSERCSPLDVCGPNAEAIVRAACGIVPGPGDHDWSSATFEGAALTVARLPVAGSPGFRLDAGPDAAPLLWDRLRNLGARPAGVVVRDILRVEAGAALFGVDIDEQVYPQEARLEAAFSLDKGCYIGQEVVAKIDTYGGLNKRLVALKVSHDDPIASGTRLFRSEENEWRDLGVVTSWAYSFVLDTGLVLAYVKRRHQSAGTVFRVGETDASAVRSGTVAVTGGFE
jgi:folate-binding protein YgfZ